jgi:dehydrogenase/reductase SDR family protein 12
MPSMNKPDTHGDLAPLPEAIDALLELAVIPSFTRVGSIVRSRLFGWRDPAPQALAGRTTLVTGATGGLGRAVAHAFARLGARVVIVGRDPARLAALQSELAAVAGVDASEAAAATFPFVVANLASVQETRAAVAAIRQLAPTLDVLVDNAGAIFAERTTGPDGGEASMDLMVVSPFALIAGLQPSLDAVSGARVISVTSGGQYTTSLDVDDLDGEAVEYNGPRFYARAKRAQVALIREWARRRAGSGVRYLAMHPGWAATPGLEASLPAFSRVMGPLLRTPAEGVDTIIWLATAPTQELRPGRLYLDRRVRPFDRVPWTRIGSADRRRLWEAVVGRAGIADPAPA